MAAATIKRLASISLVAAGFFLWLSALLLLAKTAEDSVEFDRLHNLILLINAAGALILLLLIIANLYRMVRDYRNGVPGSRLKAKMVTTFIILAVLPLLVVFYFSVQFLEKGIDSWFDVNVESGLQSALNLSQTALDIRKREYLGRTEKMAEQLADWSDRDLVLELGVLRRESDAMELTVVGQNSRIIATSSDRPADLTEITPNEEILLQIRQGRNYVALDPLDQGGFTVRTAARIPHLSPTDDQRVLLAVFPVIERLGDMANTVDQAFTDYRNMAFLREPLKTSLQVSLTLVLLLSLLADVYGAFFFARRLVQPIEQLVAGTRAVAEGDFDTRLPLQSKDEMGFLVNSFNDMTQRLAQAREYAHQSQQAVETERANLAIILARLSTGVVSLESDFRIRTANQAAGAILGIDLDDRVGESLAEIAEQHAMLRQFFDVAQAHMERGDTDWREQIVIKGEVGRRVLMCACTALPAEDGRPAGFVVVFDDITALLQAQRDSAWGEVARRLAHEIKNPLTPIQLSAERMRRKYLDTMDATEVQVLDRATHTIVQQVEAMKEMVNAFSEYARAPDMEMSLFDLNRVIHEVADLYRARENGAHLEVKLDENIPAIEADQGRVRQILHNLIRNSLEAMEGQDDAEIDVETQLDRRDTFQVVVITVRDNGPGFQMDTVEQVFDPYVTSKPKGTGLGLSIVKKLVEEHGGRIQASNHVEGGAEIKIELPLDDTARDAMLPRISSRTEKRRERA